MTEEQRGRRGNMVMNRVADSKGTDLGLHWWFWCPGCDELHAYTTPRWTRTGTDAKPTFAPSLLCTWGADNPARCHLFLREGVLEFLNDSTHALGGSKVPLPEPPEWLYD